MIDALEETIFPLFTLLGIILRILGALGVGAVVGGVLKNVVDREENTKYLIPVVFVATVILTIALGSSGGARLDSAFGTDLGSPGSPGTLGAFGLGATLGYFMIGRNKEEE